MSTLTRRGAFANSSAKLPALQAARAQDPAVQQALEQIREWLEVRLGARGDRFERAVTFRDLTTELQALEARLAELIASAGASAGTEVGAATVEQLEDLRSTVTDLRSAFDALSSSLTAQVGSAIARAAAAGDFSSNTSTSVDSEVVLFSGTGGKTGKRASGTGFAKLASGVLSAQAASAARADLGEKVQALTDGATISVDASLANNFRVTLGGNRTLANPSNLIDGQVLNFRIKQDGTGSRTLAYGSKYKFPGGAAPVLSTAAAALDFMSCQYDSTDDTLVCVLSKAFA